MPEQDAPLEGTPRDRHVDLPPEDGDDTTTVEAGPPASHLRDGDDAENERDERTVQQAVSSPSIVTDSPSRESAPPTGAAASAAPPPSIPPPLPSAALAPRKKAATPPPTDLEDTDLEVVEEDSADDSITAAAPRPGAKFAGMAIPGSVEIRTVEHDELLDETEVRTEPGHVPTTQRTGPSAHVASSSPRPAAGVPASAARPASAPEPADDEHDDDGVTTEAPAPRLGSAPELAASIGISPTSLAPSTAAQATLRSAPAADEKLVESVDEVLTRPGLQGVKELLTRPGLGVPLSGRKLPTLASDAADDDESVTTRGPAVDRNRDDSVTAQAPSLSAPRLASARAAVASGPRGIGDATLDDSTEGTTKKVQKKVRKAPDAPPSDPLPADGEAESITTQAPAPLTNILRVIAADPGSADDVTRGIEDEEESAENRTAVMANAPLKRIVADALANPPPNGAAAIAAIRPTGPPLTVPQQHPPPAYGSAATQLAPGSESGLRLAHASGERPVTGADGRTSPTGPQDGRPFAATEVAFAPPATTLQPSLHDVQLGKGPRYGLLVASVAIISFLVPVTLFVVLKGRTEEPVASGVPAAPMSDLQQHDMVPRGKLKSAGVVPSASASASGSSSAHKPPARPPFGRR